MASFEYEIERTWPLNANKSVCHLEDWGVKVAEVFMDQPLSLKIMVFLAILQGIGGFLRALNWVQIGVNLFGEGLLLLPFVGALAVMRGLFISVVALLYMLFVVGALMGRGWSWWTCLAAVIINLLLVLRALAQEALVAQALVWSVIPIILVFYLFSHAGRNALKGA